MMVNSIDHKVVAGLAKESVAPAVPAQVLGSTCRSARVPAPHLKFGPPPGECDVSSPMRCAFELVQRGRLILDVSAADVEAAEAAFGAFHPTTWHFRNSLTEAQRSWERLRAEVGTKVVEAALEQPPLTVLTLGKSTDTQPEVVVILIAGQTYRPQRVIGTELAPIQWRLTRLRPPLENGPYYVCRLANGLTQCDCADWTYQIAETEKVRTARCKHLAALCALGWI
jgi:hypothetical protein